MSNGDPLRAKVKAVFSENIEETLRVAKERKSSPDLTHVKQVQDQTTLPLMAHRIYKNPAYYFQLAQANKLKHFRNLETGTNLTFPPVKNAE